MHLFAFIALAALLSAMIAGLTPLLRATSTAPKLAVHAGDDHSAGGRFELGALLLAAQIAFSLCSLSGAALLDGTLSSLRDTRRDLTLDGVVTFSLAPIADTYKGRDLTGCYQRLLQEVRGIPGVEAAALAENTPMGTWASPFDVEKSSPNAEGGTATSGCVSSQPFPTLKTPLLAGRLFDSGERISAGMVAIVNQGLGNKLFGNASAIGERIDFGSGADIRDRRVVGVDRDQGYRGLR